MRQNTRWAICLPLQRKWVKKRLKRASTSIHNEKAAQCGAAFFMSFDIGFRQSRALPKLLEIRGPLS